MPFSCARKSVRVLQCCSSEIHDSLKECKSIPIRSLRDQIMDYGTRWPFWISARQCCYAYCTSSFKCLEENILLWANHTSLTYAIILHLSVEGTYIFYIQFQSFCFSVLETHLHSPSIPHFLCTKVYPSLLSHEATHLVAFYGWKIRKLQAC